MKFGKVSGPSGLMAVFLLQVFFNSSVMAKNAENHEGARVRVSVDPRIELLSVVQYLSDYKGFDGSPVLTSLEFRYKREALSYFSPYKDHRAVSLFKEMSGRGFWYSHPPAALLHYSDPPELAEQWPVDDFTLKMAEGKEKLDEFIEQLRSFALESRFMEFFQNHEKDYAVIVEAFTVDDQGEFVKYLEDFNGYGQGSYHIILSPFLHPGGYGPRVRVSDGRYDCYMLTGPKDVKDDRPVFGRIKEVRRLAWHEFGHSFVNHLTDAHIAELLEPCGLLLADQREEVEKAGIPWEIHVADWVSENINRAVVGRLCNRTEGPEMAARVVQSDFSFGFTFAPAVYKCLEAYEGDRDNYPTLAAFYPRIVEVFRQGAAEYKASRSDER